MKPLTVSALGDQSITIHLGSEINEATNQKCLALAQHIQNAAIPGIQQIIPAYTTVSVVYNAVQLAATFHTNSPAAFIHKKLQELLLDFSLEISQAPGTVTIPACFHESLAPDLYSICQLKQLSISQFLQQFMAKPYRVYMIGFLPGFAYMGKVDEALTMPRKEKPHLNIPAGSIGIAGNQTGIYPMDSPGGWNIIGRTPVKMFDLTANDPCFLKAGDSVTFKPISIEEFHHLNQHQ